MENSKDSEASLETTESYNEYETRRLRSILQKLSPEDQNFVQARAMEILASLSPGDLNFLGNYLLRIGVDKTDVQSPVIIPKYHRLSKDLEYALHQFTDPSAEQAPRQTHYARLKRVDRFISKYVYMEAVCDGPPVKRLDVQVLKHRFLEAIDTKRLILKS
jgi:hypothetical protein